MTDVFDNTIICAKCSTAMEKASIAKDGFLIRAVVCGKCGSKALHPHDVQEYEKFKQIRNKTYKVKLRIVGNSYAVSIPKEIVSLMQEQENMMDDFVQLCFKEFGKVSMQFGEEHEDEE